MSTIRYIDNSRVIIQPLGTMLSFPGTAGNVKLGTVGPFSGTFYISMDVKWAGPNGGFQTLIAQRNGYNAGSLTFSMAISNTTNQLGVDTVNTFVPFGYTFPINTITHMTWAHGAGTEILYINGTKNSGQGPGTLGSGTSSLIVIGANQNPSQDWFNGRINNVFIGNGTLSDDDAYALFIGSRRPGTVWANLPFTDGSGSIAVDASGNGHNGTISGATFVADGPVKLRQAASGRTVVSRTVIT